MPIWPRGLLTSQHSSLAKEVHVCLHSFNRTIACGAPSIKPCARPELLTPWRACLRSEAGPSPGVPGSVGQEGSPEHALSMGSQVRPMLLVWSPTIRRPGPGIFHSHAPVPLPAPHWLALSWEAPKPACHYWTTTLAVPCHPPNSEALGGRAQQSWHWEASKSQTCKGIFPAADAAKAVQWPAALNTQKPKWEVMPVV